MAYAIAKKEGRNGSIAFSFEADNVGFIAELEEKCLKTDVLIQVASNLNIVDDYHPISCVTQSDIFEYVIEKSFHLTDVCSAGKHVYVNRSRE